MARTLTPERQKLKQDAIRLRQELGWSERKIANHLSLPKPTIHDWLVGISDCNVVGNNNHLDLNKVYIMDCIGGMNRLPHDYVDLVFADPPYNIGVDYGNGSPWADKHDAYADWCYEWFRGVERILKPGGAFYLVQYPEACVYLLPRLQALRLNLQRWIVWHYPTNIGQSPNNWTRSHRAILFCTKGNTPAYFDGLADPQPYRNPTDKRIIENMKERAGVVPYDVWTYNLVKNVSNDKTSWPNQIPVPLIERIVKVSCPPQGIVCDPFMGSGSTAVAAKKSQRQWIGFDIIPDSRKETERRVGEL